MDTTTTMNEYENDWVFLEGFNIFLMSNGEPLKEIPNNINWSAGLRIETQDYTGGVITQKKGCKLQLTGCILSQSTLIPTRQSRVDFLAEDNWNHFSACGSRFQGVALVGSFASIDLDNCSFFRGSLQEFGATTGHVIETSFWKTLLLDSDLWNLRWANNFGANKLQVVDDRGYRPFHFSAGYCEDMTVEVSDPEGHVWHSGCRYITSADDACSHWANSYGSSNFERDRGSRYACEIRNVEAVLLEHPNFFTPKSEAKEWIQRVTEQAWEKFIPGDIVLILEDYDRIKKVAMVCLNGTVQWLNNQVFMNYSEEGVDMDDERWRRAQKVGSMREFVLKDKSR